MPHLSRTLYHFFIAPIFIIFAMLVSTPAIMSVIERRYEEVASFSIKLETWIAVIVLGIYVDQLSEFPDAPRTSLGVDGIELTSVSLTYAFRRALGAFREPASFAVWIILPFFLGMKSQRWRT